MTFTADGSADAPRRAEVSPVGDDALPRRIAVGDEAALRQVRDRVGRIIAFRGFGMPQEDRRDLQQDVVTQIWEAVRRPDFDFGRGFWGFVEVVTARRCIDWLRGRRWTEDIEDSPHADAGRTPLESVLARERVELAHLVLARLDRGCRDLIYMHAGMNRTYREIAQLVGGTEGALRVRLHRCVKRARTLIEQIAGGGPLPEADD